MVDNKTDRGGYKSNAGLDEQLMMAIVRTAELFKKRMGAIFINYGLTFPQYNVLRILETSSGGKNTITTVSRMMLVSGANMTGIAKRLEKNGFLIRRGDAKDERITLLEITPKGKDTLKNIYREKEASLKQIIGLASTESNKKMLDRLQEISETMSKD